MTTKSITPFEIQDCECMYSDISSRVVKVCCKRRRRKMKNTRTKDVKKETVVEKDEAQSCWCEKISKAGSRPHPQLHPVSLIAGNAPN